MQTSLDAGNTFVWAYGILAFTYLAISLLVVRALIKNSSARNASGYFYVGLFLFIAMGMASRFLLHDIWIENGVEMFLLLIAIVPVIFFLSFKREYSFFGGENGSASSQRFDRLKDEFLTVASHELRTPLSVINGFAEILVREKLGKLNDEQKRRIRKILMQGQRLNRIIDELLDLSRIRSGKIEVRRDVFDIIPVLKSCLDDQQVVCEQQHITLEDQIPDVLPDVIGDLERVTQVVINLMGNAIKYTPAYGKVALTGLFDKERNEIRVEVNDTGIGIAHEEQSRVFEEFYRSSHKQVRKYSGSGLGLAIVQQLVEAQGGRVGLSSEGEGKGSVFFFTLPASKSAKKSEAKYVKET